MLFFKMYLTVESITGVPFFTHWPPPPPTRPPGVYSSCLPPHLHVYSLPGNHRVRGLHLNSQESLERSDSLWGFCLLFYFFFFFSELETRAMCCSWEERWEGRTDAGLRILSRVPARISPKGGHHVFSAVRTLTGAHRSSPVMPFCTQDHEGKYRVRNQLLALLTFGPQILVCNTVE